MQDEGKKEKNAGKQVRTAVEILFLIGCLVAAFVLSVGVSETEEPTIVVEEIPTVYQTAYEGGILSAGEAEGYPLIQYGEAHFTALCYPGLTAESQDGRRVNLAQFKLHMEQLSRAGYQTITPEDASAFLAESVWPPQKAVMIILEDDTLQSANLARETLESLDYTAVLAVYAKDLETGKISSESVKQLELDGHFVVASRGYERSYINVFDHQGNYIGELTADEFDAVSNAVGDYTYSLMDFKRDSDRLPTESEEVLQQRIAEDYRKAALIFREKIGRMPQMLMLTGPNTGAFGKTDAASQANQKLIQSHYEINFNRMGTAISTQAIPVYDLSYMQVASDFSANHLMMKLWDDTADDVVFALGSPDEAAKWMVDRGIAEFDAGEMILTTLPGSSASAAIRNLLVDDFELDVVLRGAIAGRQSIFLRTDRNCQAGVELCFEDGVLTIREAGDKTHAWLVANLSSLDGNRVLSEDEAELNAQIALNEAIVRYDSDASRRNEAQAALDRLKRLRVRTVAEGGKAASVILTGTERRDRTVHVSYIGDNLTVTVDGHTVANNLRVPSNGRGTIAFGAGVSAAGLAAGNPDDVYDGIFAGLTVEDTAGGIYYCYPVVVEIPVQVQVQSWMERLSRWLRGFF